MPKYTQTLTGTTYNATDFSTSLKTAFDSLGWGTGKVDISGGYRFTGTDQSNAETTPLVVNSFQENYMGKNLVNPMTNVQYQGGMYYLGMYLPGVSSFRLKYTVMSDTYSSGTVFNTPALARQAMLYCYHTSKPEFSNEQTQTVVRDVKSFPSTLTVGTQYTTDWTTSDISSHPGILIKHTLEGTYLRLDAIEYKISQNKFAFQSPNLDSPTFESNTINYNGTLFSTITSYPIRDSKVPIVRLIKVGGLGGSALFDYSNGDGYEASGVLQCWNEAIFSYSDDSSKIGVALASVIKDRIAEANFGNDIVIRAGSNTTFQGFYINTTQGGVSNGTVWDTIDKTRTYPNATPSYPSQRKSRINMFNNGRTIDDGVKYYSSSVAGNAYHSNFYTIKVKNTATFSGFFITDSWAYQYMDLQDHTIDYVVHTATKQSDGTFKLTGVVHPLTTKTLTVRNNYSNRNFVQFNSDLTLNSGYYVIAIRSNRQRVYMKYTAGGTDEFTTIYKARDFEATSHSNFCANIAQITFPGIRYVRTSMTGSNTNSGNHWVEIQALSSSGTNYALSSTVTVTSGTLTSGSNLNTLKDGSTDTYQYTDITGVAGTNLAQVTLDLGSVKSDISKIKIWRYYADGRVYYNQVVEVSTDGVTWYRVDDGKDLQDTSAGREYVLPAYNSLYNVITPYQFTASTNTNNYTVNNVLGTGAPSRYSHLNLVLEQTSSPTPSQQTTSFAENWISAAGKSNYYPSSALRREAVSKYATGTFTFEAKAPFGVDLQSHTAIANAASFLLMTYPGEGSETSGHSLRNNSNGTRNLEFTNNTNRFENGVRYHRVWYINRTGMALRSRSLFLHPAGVGGLGASYVTPDGAEYVVVNYISDGNNSAVLFRLTT